MARHRKTPTTTALRRIRMRIAALGAALAFAAVSLGAVLPGGADAAAPTHQAFYAHLSGNTYAIKLTGWAPTTDVSLFKQKGSDANYYQVVNAGPTFSGSVTFRVGINYGTVLEIQVFNGRKSDYVFYLDTRTAAAPAAQHALAK